MMMRSEKRMAESSQRWRGNIHIGSRDQNVMRMRCDVMRASVMVALCLAASHSDCTECGEGEMVWHLSCAERKGASSAQPRG